MFERVIRRKTIRYKGAQICALMECLPCGILVMREHRTIKTRNGKEEKINILPGVVWLPSRELDRTTKGATQFLLCEDVYEALRICMYTHNGYGVGANVAGTESAKLAEGIATARSLSRAMQRRSRLTERERTANDQIQYVLSEDLLAKRNDEKIRAGEHIANALETVVEDSLGRPNPSAARFQLAGGIGSLIKRSLELAQIDERIQCRATVIGEYIKMMMIEYDALWNVLCGEPNIESKSRLWRLMYVIQQGNLPHATPRWKRRAAESFPQVKVLLGDHQCAFERIIALPFQRNASHVLKDLASAVACCGSGDYIGLRKRLETIRRGIRWIYALNFLHFEALMPLAFRIARNDVDAGRCDDIRHSLHAFGMKLAKCGDEHLAVPVKVRVQTSLADAVAAMNADEWLKAKDALKSIAAVL